VSLTYLNYLKIDELLELQQPKSEPVEHDEMLFIIIHQTYELWFKQILHEMELLKIHLQTGETWTSVKTMRRILVIMKTLVGQTDILETMTPLSFNQFRKFLENASGFQSVQFREMEILCGFRFGLMHSYHSDNTEATSIINRRMAEPTLWESFCEYLRKRGYDIAIPERINVRGLMYETTQDIQDTLVHIMKNDPEAALLSELFVDFDEGLLEWRYRHVKMVERTIGTKKGTGGSDGVQYLKKTLEYKAFPDLWEIRTRF